MKIAFEASNLISNKPTGIGRYGKHFIQSIVDMMPNDVKILYKASRLKSKYRHDWLGLGHVPSQAYLGSIWPLVKNVDIVHGLDTILPRWKQCKKVITIHDLLPLLQEHDSIATKAFRRKKFIKYREVLAISDLIITVSENTRKDVLEYFQLPESKVINVYPGVNAHHFYPRNINEVNNIRKKYNITRDYLLFVGSISGRKNTERLVLAYSASKAKEQYDLVLVGQISHFGEKTIAAIKKSGVDNKTHLLAYVPDEDLAALYTGATGFCFPTLYEGFGFPILESMLCQTPVLTSNTGSSPEVANAFALLVDPYSIKSIANGIDQLVGRKDSDVFSASEYAKKFSWKCSANNMMHIYRSLMA